MDYKNIILIPEGILFKEKTSQRNALKKLAQAHNTEFNTDLFISLFERYENAARQVELELILTAFLPKENKADIEQEYFTYLSHQHRLLKNANETLNELNSKTNLFITSIYPQKVISHRLQKAQIDLKPAGSEKNEFSSMTKAIDSIIKQNKLNKSETLIIGSNLSDEIQTANDLQIPSLWINTNRKVPITPHPTLHVKKFEDVLFYFMNNN